MADISKLEQPTADVVEVGKINEQIIRKQIDRLNQRKEVKTKCTTL